MRHVQTITCASAVHPLRALRRAKGFSLRQLGERSTIDYRLLWLIEARGLRPTLMQKRLLAAALGVPVADLEPKRAHAVARKKLGRGLK